MSKSVIIASTTLHIFDAIIIANQYPKNDYHLFYIDQNSNHNIYIDALRQWEASPFNTIDIHVTLKNGLFDKISSKRKSIKSLISQIDTLNPQEIIVGNDRKNEISALIQHTIKTLPKKTISYMDDGIHTYISEKSSIFKYTCFDNLLKRLIYGHKIHTPKRVGTASYIENVYIYKPDLAHDAIRAKVCFPLDVNYLQSNAFGNYVKLLFADNQAYIKKLQQTKYLFFLPHPKEMDTKKINHLIQIFTQNKNISIKLHPRDSENRKRFKSLGFDLLPNELSSEVIVLGAGADTNIFGFSTTALLMANWLRNDLQIYNLTFQSTLTEIEKLMDRNQITLLPFERLSNSLD